MDFEDLGDDAADLGGGIELPTTALATFGGEVPHEVLVGVTEDVVASRSAVLREVESGILEDCDQVRESRSTRFLSVPKFRRVVEVGEVRLLEAAADCGFCSNT